MKLGDYVRIGKGRKVYEIVHVWKRVGLPDKFKLAATADHPDAAVREQDAFAWYHESRLALVRRR